MSVKTEEVIVERIEAIEEIITLRGERLAILETKMSHTLEQYRVQNEKLDTLIRKIDKYEGKLGGIFLVIGALIAFFKIEWTKVLAILGKGGG